MRKLTKKIKRMHKDYKPTIGISLPSGIRMSVNAVEYRIAIETREKEEAEREFKRLAHQAIREICPGFAALEDALSSLGSWTYF